MPFFQYFRAPARVVILADLAKGQKGPKAHFSPFCPFF
jgi:hypothetical protein